MRKILQKSRPLIVSLYLAAGCNVTAQAELGRAPSFEAEFSVDQPKHVCQFHPKDGLVALVAIKEAAVSVARMVVDHSTYDVSAPVDNGDALFKYHGIVVWKRAGQENLLMSAVTGMDADALRYKVEINGFVQLIPDMYKKCLSKRDLSL